MSAVPVFSFTTTADEVAIAFAEEIKGKNGTLTADGHPNIFLTFDSLNHRDVTEWDRLRDRPGDRKARQSCYNHWIRRREVRSIPFV
jgi:hypothetical protein